MVIEKYHAPQPGQYHDKTVGYLDVLREKSMREGVNHQIRYIEKMIKDPNIGEYERLHVVR